MRRKRIADSQVTGGRVCSWCATWQPNGEFRRHSAAKGGLHPWCRTCRAEREWEKRDCEKRRLVNGHLSQAVKARNTPELVRACNAMLEAVGGPALFVERFSTWFEQAKVGSAYRGRAFTVVAKLLLAVDRLQSAESGRGARAWKGAGVHDYGDTSGAGAVDLTGADPGELEAAMRRGLATLAATRPELLAVELAARGWNVEAPPASAPARDA